MNKIIQTKWDKITVDISMIAMFFAVNSHNTSSETWNSSHCIFGMVWFALMILHIWQHWRLIKAFTKKRVIVKNKITALTILCFALMSVSILAMISGFSAPVLKYHNIVGHLFMLMIIIHTIQKFKRLLALFKK